MIPSGVIHIVWAIAPNPSVREAMLGDFAEEFDERARRHGPAAARRWCWHEAVRTTLGTLRHTIPSGGVILRSVLPALLWGYLVFLASAATLVLMAVLVLDPRPGVADPAILLLLPLLLVVIPTLILAGCETARIGAKAPLWSAVIPSDSLHGCASPAGPLSPQRARHDMTVRMVSVALAALCGAAQSLNGQAQPTLVDVGGHRLNVQVTGTSKPGVPTIVFESGGGSTLAAWNGLHLTIGDSVRTIVYERAGIGASEGVVRNFTESVAELHTLLERVGAHPPYVLVGHSLGGPLINMFAATYPREVAGLVHIDPGDFMQTRADMTAVWEKVGVKNGEDSLRSVYVRMQSIAGMPTGVRAEAREIDRVEQGGFEEFRAAGEAPDVPLVVLLAGKPDAMPPAFPDWYGRYWQASFEQRLDHFGKLAARASKGTLVLTTKSSHFIHLSEPELAVWAIRRVLSSATSHPALDRFVGQYRLTPTITITVTRDDDKLIVQLTGQPAVPVAQETPTTFSGRMAGAMFEFEVDATGNVTGVVLVQNGRRLPAPRIPR